MVDYQVRGYVWPPATFLLSYPGVTEEIFEEGLGFDGSSIRG